MPGHPECGKGTELTDWDRKLERKRLNELNPPKMTLPTQVKYPKVGRPKNKTKQSESLKQEPKTVPIEEHPYILWLAERWEDFESQINGLKNEQEELKKAAESFEESYPQDVGQRPP